VHYLDYLVGVAVVVAFAWWLLARRRGRVAR
jgi:hypothetical protein